jgi:hypothetical protein
VKSRVSAVDLNSFHEKAGSCQDMGFLLFFLESDAIQPSRLCRHPSIRTLWLSDFSLGACWAFSFQ